MSGEPTVAEAMQVVDAIPVFTIRSGSVRRRTIAARTGLPVEKVDVVLRHLRETGFVYATGGHYQRRSRPERSLIVASIEGRFG